MKKILIIFTGGTIGMKKDAVSNADVPALSGVEILNLTPGIRDIADITYYDFGMFPGPHVTPDIMFQLSNYITATITKDNYDGVVVTHGTDSLEETAYLVDLTYDLVNPVVFLGAMKSSSDLGWDGPANLIEAVYTATSAEAYNRGVLVVMNSEIHSASQVTKTHTNSFGTFKSSDFGPVGFIDNNKAYFYQTYSKKQTIKTNKIDTNVDLIKCAAGMDDRLIKFCVDSGTHGIVIEGMGRGNIPPAMVPGVQYAIDKNIPIIIVSRCQMGRAFDSYGYPGAGKQLTQIGAILGDNLPGQKARIKLIVSLGITKDIQKIKELFEINYK